MIHSQIYVAGFLLLHLMKEELIGDNLFCEYRDGGLES